MIVLMDRHDRCLFRGARHWSKERFPSTGAIRQSGRNFRGCGWRRQPGNTGIERPPRIAQVKRNSLDYESILYYHTVYAQANRRPSGVVIASQITNNIIIVCGVVSSILDKIFFFFGFCSGKRENVSE